MEDLKKVFKDKLTDRAMPTTDAEIDSLIFILCSSDRPTFIYMTEDEKRLFLRLANTFGIPNTPGQINQLTSELFVQIKEMLVFNALTYRVNYAPRKYFFDPANPHSLCAQQGEFQDLAKKITQMFRNNHRDLAVDLIEKIIKIRERLGERLGLDARHIRVIDGLKELKDFIDSSDVVFHDPPIEIRWADNHFSFKHPRRVDWLRIHEIRELLHQDYERKREREREYERYIERQRQLLAIAEERETEGFKGRYQGIPQQKGISVDTQPKEERERKRREIVGEREIKRTEELAREKEEKDRRERAAGRASDSDSDTDDDFDVDNMSVFMDDDVSMGGGYYKKYLKYKNKYLELKRKFK